MGEKNYHAVFFMYLSSPLAHHFRFSDVLLPCQLILATCIIIEFLYSFFDMTKRLGMINEKLLPFVSVLSIFK